MVSSPDLSFSRTLSSRVFHQLGELLQQMAQAEGNEPVLIVTQAVLAPLPILPKKWHKKQFTVVVSHKFSALLVGKQTMHESFEQEAEEKEWPTYMVSPLSSEDFLVDMSLTFNSETIISFILELKELFEPNSHTYHNLEYYSQIPCPNDSSVQSQFTLLLLECFLSEPNQDLTLSSPSIYSHVSVCQPVEEALKKQIAQEQVLNRVTTQIRKSLDLSVIMATAVAQVREFLELDRLVIYKFESSNLNRQESPPNSIASAVQLLPESLVCRGCIVYEILATNAIPSVLNYKEEHCFTPTSQCWEKYRKGFTLAVDDVEKTYALEECLLTFLRQTHVRAKLAAPIIFEEKLWGLLIAHQCDAPRSWNENEIKLLSAIAEQLAVAIHQAELMHSLKQEKQNLEQRVVERTIALHDALAAAQGASRLKSEFLATVSHELLTPLTYVIGMSSTLLRWSFGELSQRQRDYLQTIHDCGEHLLAMINDILDLSQIEAGKAVLDITEFSLTIIAQNTVNALQEEATFQQVNLKLDSQINPERDLFTADVRRVEQILRNLLSNAIKFTPEGGDVTFRLWLEDNSAVFQVEDTGIGISEEQLSQLFEKFHQLDPPYRRRYEGTGLGLALTKQLVELHRGRIEVESTLGVGSIFTVWIPAQPLPLLSED
jgi:two-component system sensor histidine kinase/response regulator